MLELFQEEKKFSKLKKKNNNVHVSGIIETDPEYCHALKKSFGNLHKEDGFGHLIVSKGKIISEIIFRNHVWENSFRQCKALLQMCTNISQCLGSAFHGSTSLAII